MRLRPAIAAGAPHRFLGFSSKLHLLIVAGKVYDADGLLLPDAKPYTANPVTREDNHPLEAMVE